MAKYIDGNGLARLWAGIKTKLNALEAKINGKATVSSYTADFSVAGWSAAAPYVQTVSVSGITAAMEPLADLVVSTTAGEAMEQLAAWSCVGRLATGAGNVTAYCYGSKPDAAIHIRMKVVA
ncbi:MAG: hypothetical protein RR521_12920 [Clostridia bacterium]